MSYNWDDARIFLAAARTGKLGAAADKLNLTPITVSRRIAGLEARLNTVLFARHRHGVELTESGQEFFDIFERAEREMMSASAKADAGDFSMGLVRIAATDGFANGLIAPHLDALMEEAPGMRVELVPLSRHFSLSRREADIAVTIGMPSGDRLRSEFLANYSLGIYASKAYLNDREPPRRAEDLKSYRLIGYVDDLLIHEDLNYAKDIWRDWNSQLSIHSAFGQIEAVKSGAGVGVLHNYLIPSESGLIRILPDIEITREYWLVTHENIRSLPRIQAAMRFLRCISKTVR